MRIRNPRLIRLGARLLLGFCRLIARTYRVRLIDEAPETNRILQARDERYLFSVWHDQLNAPLGLSRKTWRDPISLKPETCVALVSQHRDGSFLDAILQAVGLDSVRGSTTRGGGRAIRELMHTASGRDILVTPDGPQGPEHVMKSGIVFLASHMGRSIIPVVVKGDRAWRIPAKWTHQLIPKPFCQFVLYAGRAVHVPPDLDREGIERYTARLQAEMDRVNAIADRILAGEPVESAAAPTVQGSPRKAA